MKTIFAVLAFLLVAGFTSSTVYAEDNSKQSTVVFNSKTYVTDLQLLIREQKIEEAVKLAKTAFQTANEKYQKPFDVDAYRKKGEEYNPGINIDIYEAGRIIKSWESEDLAEYSYLLGTVLALNGEFTKGKYYSSLALGLYPGNVKYRKNFETIQNILETLK